MAAVWSPAANRASPLTDGSSGAGACGIAGRAARRRTRTFTTTSTTRAGTVYAANTAHAEAIGSVTSSRIFSSEYDTPATVFQVARREPIRTYSCRIVLTHTTVAPMNATGA